MPRQPDHRAEIVMRYAISTGLGFATLLLALAGDANAASGAKIPFSDEPQNMTVTQRRAACQYRYDTQMKISETHYGRLMKEQKDIGDRLNQELSRLRPQKLIYAKEIAEKEGQLGEAAHMFTQLRIERLHKEQDFKDILMKCFYEAEHPPK
jgi:hypothetical protein